MLKKVPFPVLVLFFCSTVLSCPPPEVPVHYYITGHAYDCMNGAPVPNAAVRYGELSGVSGTDGSFSIDLGTAAGVMSQPMGWSAPGYRFMYVDPVRVDTAEDNVMTIHLEPLSEALYSRKEIRCRVYDSGGIEITTAESVILGVLPRNGKIGAWQATSYNGTDNCYDFEPNRHSADCLVLAIVDMPFASSADSFFVHLTGVDLSGPGTVDLRFDEPASGYTGVTLTAESTDSAASAQYDTSYGFFPVIGTFVDDAGPETKIGGEVEFSDGTSETFTVYNPAGWRWYWSQRGAFDTVSLPPGVKAFMSTGAFSSMSAAVTLPALDSGRGPDALPDSGTWLYDPAAGSLSIGAVAGTQIYQYNVLDTTAEPDDITFGTMVLFGNSRVLPSWLNLVIADDSPRTMYLTLMDTDLEAYEPWMTGLDNYPPSAAFGVVMDWVVVPSPQPVPFVKEFSF